MLKVENGLQRHTFTTFTIRADIIYPPKKAAA